MKAGLIVIGAILIVVGLIWMGQDANFIGGSFMTGQPLWLVIGLFAVLMGAGLVLWSVVGYRRFP